MENKDHQRIIRERQSTLEENETLWGNYWESLNLSLKDALVQPVNYQTASTIILKYEWLGNMGTTEYSYGIYFDDVLGGVVCFGHTGGTNVYASALPQNHNLMITLNRGACAFWTPTGSASKLISTACRMMGENGYYGFVAYADPKAGEVGTVYQACNWLYCGLTNPTEQSRTPNGDVKDARLVHNYTRDMRFGKLRYKRTRAEQKKLMVDQGYQFFKGHSKGRYIGIYGSRKIKKELYKELNWSNYPYPKRI